ncbi:LLM class flavin-dependent oxidoreductase [Amycolatopsis rhabdoformis]|uniref:LLM class flavin-dependent oxidoreductase n=1 Tax=Amycolatopsis rhabdoformis TaxID=1448059 RepID=A0ABZ1IDI9_9PSEU|nr:LLM class flavin-dependent oxidoreductase [Amycolatopsis rhabdoformis]WSE32510.1 LLM class flavin-dependent oxidoreductase [Amycolatopsis rhabdoformis]
MRLGTSLRFKFASSPESMTKYHEKVARGEFTDIPLGEPDARLQAAQLLEIGALVAEAGLDFLMVGDGHASADANIFAPVPTLARLQAVTGDLPLGLLHLAPFHHPVIAAEQIGTLAAFAPEPLTLVLGNGDDSTQFRGFGISKASRGRRTEEQITLIRRLLAGEEVTHESPYFSVHGVRINPIPRVPTPIWVAATRGAAVERAGRLGDGWETSPLAPPDALVEQLGVYTRAAQAAGRPVNPILRRDIHVAATDEAAWEAVDPIFAAGYRGVGSAADTALVGSAATVIERLKFYRGLGFDFVLVRHIVGDHRLILDSIRRIGDEVLPAIRSL